MSDGKNDALSSQYSPVEPEIVWVPGNRGDYETIGIAPRHIASAYGDGSWKVYRSAAEVTSVIAKGQAADSVTAKACVIAYCREHKLHMFAEPEWTERDHLWAREIEIARLTKRVRELERAIGIAERVMKSVEDKSSTACCFVCDAGEIS